MSHREKDAQLPSIEGRNWSAKLRGLTWRGCLAMAAATIAQALCWGLIMTYGTILAFYVRFLIPDAPETLVALAGAIPPFLLLALALLWGRLLDAGHHRILNVIAGFFLTTGMVSLSFTGGSTYSSGQYWAILLASVPMGIGQSIYFLSAPHIAKSWHPRHKGLAMGITNSGAALGGVLWPLVFDTLVQARGFREGVGTIAGIACALSIFVALFAVPAPNFQAHSMPDLAKVRTWVPTRAFRSRVFVVHIVSMCFVYLGILGLPFFLELWARRNDPISVSEDVRGGYGIDMDRSPELGVYLIVTLNACQLPGRLFGSSLCDKVKARKIHACACIVACGTIATCWFSVDSFRGGIGFAAVYGLVLGIMVSLPINDAADLLGDSRTHLLGQYAGVVYMCCAPFILAGAVIVGAFVTVYDVFIAPAVWCIACFAIAAFLIVVGLSMKDDTHHFDEATPTAESDYGGPTRVGSPRAEDADKDTSTRSPSETESGSEEESGKNYRPWRFQHGTSQGQIEVAA